jgi:hypothetical protein
MRLESRQRLCPENIAKNHGLPFGTARISLYRYTCAGCEMLLYIPFVTLILVSVIFVFPWALVEVTTKSHRLPLLLPFPYHTPAFPLPQSRFSRDGGPQRTTSLTASVPVPQRHRFRAVGVVLSPQATLNEEF